MKRLFNILFASFLFVITATAQAPDDYYSSCKGKSGQTLLSALFDVIGIIQWWDIANFGLCTVLPTYVRMVQYGTCIRPSIGFHKMNNVATIPM